MLQLGNLINNNPLCFIWFDYGLWYMTIVEMLASRAWSALAIWLVVVFDGMKRCTVMTDKERSAFWLPKSLASKSQVLDCISIVYYQVKLPRRRISREELAHSSGSTWWRAHPSRYLFCRDLLRDVPAAIVESKVTDQVQLVHGDNLLTLVPPRLEAWSLNRTPAAFDSILAALGNNVYALVLACFGRRPPPSPPTS